MEPTTMAPGAGQGAIGSQATAVTSSAEHHHIAPFAAGRETGSQRHAIDTTLTASHPFAITTHGSDQVTDSNNQPPHVKRQRRMAAVLLLSSTLAMLEARAPSLPVQATRVALPSSKQHQRRQQAELLQANKLSGDRPNAKPITIITTTSSSSQAGTAATAERGKADAKTSARHSSASRTYGLARVYQRRVALQQLPDDYWECFSEGHTARHSMHLQANRTEGAALQVNQQQPGHHAQGNAWATAPGAAHMAHAATQQEQHSAPHLHGLSTMPASWGGVHASQHVRPSIDPATAAVPAVGHHGFAAQPGSAFAGQQALAIELDMDRHAGRPAEHLQGTGAGPMDTGTDVQHAALLQVHQAAASHLHHTHVQQQSMNAAAGTAPQQPAADQDVAHADQAEEDGAAELPPASPTEVPELPPASPTLEWEEI